MLSILIKGDVSEFKTVPAAQKKVTLTRDNSLLSSLVILDVAFQC